MANVIKTNPRGIDYPIQRIQTLLYNDLIAGGWTSYEAYGRVYKNLKEDKVIPEFATSNKDYKEVLFDDKFNATSFFMVDDKITYNGTGTANVSLIFQAKIDKLFPTITHRADEEMHEDIVTSLNHRNFGKITGITTGIKQVYADLNIDIEGIDDMSGFHVVKFDLIVNFNYNC